MDPTSLKHFIENCNIKVSHLDKEEIIFDLSGAEPPLANALRRIMIAEIPTIAIEKCEMWQNTSIIPDENLAHRMGLIPIAVDPRLFEMKDPSKPYDATNCVRFALHTVCTKKDPSKPTQFNIPSAAEEDALYNHANVYSGDLKWIPVAEYIQETLK